MFEVVFKLLLHSRLVIFRQMVGWFHLFFVEFHVLIVFVHLHIPLHLHFP